MHGETLVFLESLFAHCETPGFITLSALPPSDTQPTPSRHIPVHDRARLIAALDDLQAANALGWGAVYAVALRKADLGRWRRGGKTDLAALPALFVDVDHPGQISQLRSFWIPPSCLVHSGWGYHTFWLLNEPTQAFATAESIMHGLARRFNGDAIPTAAHSLRIPGTRNSKPNRANFPCSLVELYPERRYDLSDFAAYDELPSVLPKREPNTLPASSLCRSVHLNPDQVEDAARAVSDCLVRSYGGHVQRNGWIGACCPFGHSQDLPGKHFGWNPRLRRGKCFGRHGTVSLLEICHQLGVCTTGIKLGSMS